MASFYASRALLPEGWRTAVRIETESGRITAVTPGSHSDGATPLQGLVVPGMANLHSHAFQAAMAGHAEVAGNPQDSFWTWRDAMYHLVGRLTPELMADVATWLYIDMLKGGYTQVAEFHYLHHQPDGAPYPQDDMLRALIQAATTAGIGQTMLPVLYRYAGFGAQPPVEGQRRFIQSTESWLEQYQRLSSLTAGNPLLNQGVCFHSLRAVTQQDMEQVLASTPADAPVHIHIAEQQKEVNDCLASYGARPVAWLLENMPVDKRWCLVHATHLDQQEITRLAATGAVAGLCPTTEANLGDGIFPATDWLAEQGRWGIGSDSQVSRSVLEELRLLEYSQRLRDQHRNRLVQPGAPSVGDVLYTQAAMGGAQACGVQMGQLAPGMRADWLCLNADYWPQNRPDDQLINRWLFAGQRSEIRDVWVAGQAVIRDGQHPQEATYAARFRNALEALQ